MTFLSGKEKFAKFNGENNPLKDLDIDLRTGSQRIRELQVLIRALNELREERDIEREPLYAAAKQSGTPHPMGDRTRWNRKRKGGIYPTEDNVWLVPFELSRGINILGEVEDEWRRDLKVLYQRRMDIATKLAETRDDPEMCFCMADGLLDAEFK